MRRRSARSTGPMWAGWPRSVSGSGGAVHALCLRLAGDGPAARELTQDVFVRAWEALPSFRGESALGSWLHRLAVNVFLGERRQSGGREQIGKHTPEPPP